MNTSNELTAIIGAVVLGFIVRFFNVVIEWLSKALKVNEPAPIPTPGQSLSEHKD